VLELWPEWWCEQNVAGTLLDPQRAAPRHSGRYATAGKISPGKLGRAIQLRRVVDPLRRRR
jgi:hypothetical protein